MSYTIGEVAKILNLTVPTIRFYDKEGLLPYLQRNNGNARRFSEKDVEFLRIIKVLKKSGLQIKDIKKFFQWCMEGESTIKNRYELFLNQKEIIEQQIFELNQELEYIKRKIDFYEKNINSGITRYDEIKNNLMNE